MKHDNPTAKIKLQSIRPSFNYAINEIIEYLKSHESSEVTILEVGCGIRSFIGNYLRGINYPFILHGLDIDSYALNNEEVDKVFIAPAENMPFADNQYDIVIAVYLLEHLEDYRAALKEMARVLVPHGLLILIFPNPTSPEAVITRLTPLSVHKFFRKYIQKFKSAAEHTFATPFSFRSIGRVTRHLYAHGMEQVRVLFFAETYYRFRFWAIWGNLALFYAKLLSKLQLNILKSGAVVIGRKGFDF
jgi:ubiquinone/menaquinone biosynthesis C-methylase UbiE